MQREGNCEVMSLTHVGRARHSVAVLYQHYTGAITMNVSLAALNTACAVVSSTFVGFDFPPINPPHAPAAILA
jgi:hypothetical protein